MTGMDPEWARFQSLSAFTQTGFTTSEAEGVVNHPVRRRITSALMLLGAASIITLVSTFVSTLVSQDLEHSTMTLAIMVVVALILWRITASRRLAGLLSRLVRGRIEKMELLPTTAMDYLIRQAEGYGIVRVLLDEKSAPVGKSLAELGTTKEDVLVLSIQREEQMIAVPKGHDVLEPGDLLLCFGRVDSIARVFLWGTPT
jgi:uncharacterized protein with PhoU and TrkA domain